LDSKKSTTKKRGNIFWKDNTFFYKCFNCGVSYNFDFFLQKLSPHLHEAYRLEKYREQKEAETPPPPTFHFRKPQPRATFNHFLDSIQCLNTLNEDHLARSYVANRKIPLKCHQLLFFTNNFYAFIHSIQPEQFKECNKNPDIDKRLVIPFFNKSGDLFAVQGRTLTNSEMRYITIKFTDEPKIYGQERCDFTKKHYVLEGPIDSLFLPNALAMAGSDVDVSMFSKEKSVWILDNESRSRETVNKHKNLIDKGYSICIWPEWIKSKDVNDAILNENLTPERLLGIIDQCTCSGVEAQLKFSNWKKI